MRKLGLIFTFCIGLLAFPLTSLALGLGEIEVESYLNNPLKAEIPVVSARPGEIDNLLVSLASRDAFRKVGLERPAVLSRLRFKVEKSEDGTSARILVTTKKPLKEPFLNFLVEADWGKGRLLREYTILLDPPVFAQQPAPAVAEPAAESRSATEPASAPIATSGQAPETQPETETPATPPPAGDEIAYVPGEAAPEQEQQTTTATGAPSRDSIVVAKGDTLWSIASQLKDDKHSVAQIMLALQQANPDAFGQDNINFLKTGAVLRIPDPQSFDDFNKQEAYARVLEQNGLWDEYLARVSGRGSAASQGETAAAASEESAAAEEGGESTAAAAGESAGGQLSLLAPGEGDSESTGLQEQGGSDDVARIRKQLALAEEELEAVRLENKDLKSRVQDLEQQLKKFEELQQKLLQIEDSSMAQMQRNAAKSEEETAPAEAQKQEAPDGMLPDSGDQMQEQPATSETPDEDQLSPGQQTEEGTNAEPPPGGDGMTEEPLSGGPPGQTESGTDMNGMMEEAPTKGADSMLEEAPAPLADTGAGESAASGTEISAAGKETSAGKPPAPVIVTEQPQDGLLGMLPSLDDLLGDPVMLGGSAAILALLLGLLYLRRKKSAEVDDGITLDVVESGSDNDQTPIHIPEAESTSEIESTEIELPVAETPIEKTVTNLDTGTEDYDTRELLDETSRNEETLFEQTAVLNADEMEQEEETEEQDDVLNEVDVYLAYGLYDNAEDLLKSSLEEHPNRADYRAKLLDTYYATKNKAAFIEEARALRSLGAAAERFWDRVQVMGHELAPGEEMFSGAVKIDPAAVKIDYEKPQTADFDLGADVDSNDFSTDFDLGGESEKEATTLEVPETAEETGEASDDKGFSLDEDLNLGDEDELSFELPDSLEEKIEDVSEVDFEETLEANIPGEVPPPAEDDELGLSLDEEEPDLTSLEAELTGEAPEMDELPDSLNVELDLDEELTETAEEEGTRHIEAALDLDLGDDDAEALRTGTFQPADEVTEFQPAGVTGEFELPESAEEIGDQLESPESAEEIDDQLELPDTAEEIVEESVDDKTGTFAPGDFDDDKAANVTGEIEDLMLPDDVDEVATKLDLAKAFIDMGDAEGARSSLQEVLEEGSDTQKAEATELLKQIQ